MVLPSLLIKLCSTRALNLFIMLYKYHYFDLFLLFIHRIFGFSLLIWHMSHLANLLFPS